MSSEGAVAFRDWQTWYRVVGDGPRPPVVVLHGGPGATHDYLLSLAGLAGDRPVVFYDQLGNGRSTHLPQTAGDGGFWTPELFADELDNLLEQLGIGRYHVLGQSWGGFLAQEHAFRRPPGLLSLVLADTAASYASFIREAGRLRSLLPQEVQDVLSAHEAAGSTDDPTYAAACQVFYARHVCRVVPNPPEVAEAFAWIDRDPTVYHTMNGPSEFHCTGTAIGWSGLDR
jgi:L-proline amide hydrolase